MLEDAQCPLVLTSPASKARCREGASSVLLAEEALGGGEPAGSWLR